MNWVKDGCVRLPWDARVARWAEAASRDVARLDTSERRHGGTWFVGVDALRNSHDGSIDGAPLTGPWEGLVDLPTRWHQAQVSIVYQGYPRRDVDMTEAAFRYLANRDAAHLDGLLPEGPRKRRHLRETHGFVLGLPLSDVAASPLVVWPGSHRIITSVFRDAFEGVAPHNYGDLDVTEIYQSARKRVFEDCPRVEMPAKKGEATLLHRHLIHGVAPWSGGAGVRAIAYFRPLIDPQHWL